ncbi:MAG: hypothetical protein ACOYNY_07865 [Caldilineaceae bacterium]
MDNKTIATIIIIPAIIGLVILLVEYLIIQPLGGIGLLATVVISSIAITSFEYHYNKFLPFLGQQSLKTILSPWLNHYSVSFRGILEDILRTFSMMVPFSIVIAMIGSSYFIENSLLTSLKHENKITGLIVITFLLLYLSSILGKGYKGLCQLIILTGSISLFILYIPAIPTIGDAASFTVLESVLGRQSMTEKLFSVFIGIHLLILWIAGLIFLDSRNHAVPMEDEDFINEKVCSLLASNEIQRILAEQSKVKFADIQHRWAEFIEFPSDDYIYYLRHCVPISVEDQTVVLGYVNSGDKPMLDDVKMALEMDMKSHYGWRILKVKFVQIELEERNRIRMSLDKLSVNSTADPF